MADKKRTRFLFERARMALLGLIEDIPADKWCWQPQPNANHVLWSVGHIAVVDDLAISTLTGKPAEPPPPWAGLFAPGSTPQSDPAAYPSPDEVIAYLKAQRQTLLTALDAAPDDIFDRPMPSEWSHLWPDVGCALLSLAWHEGFHTGQIATIRKTLGLKPKFF